MSSIPWAALIPAIVLYLALVIYCLVDLARHPHTRLLPRWAWVVICVVISTLGAIAYLVAGREQNR
ncbi:PLD nuclease N-terminal domain-containing protein [Actinocrispum wychmicini]|uniref:Phospholipase D-like protein n=1 Tax=Actinocrispum wychmicini TaxID=1213861 RepID=A0A4R2JL65_9PSEU|nr:PLD nuclease N-terminal domain-containing protein [Actinocrispum wychmicini]TCO59597.1 phospholipase D-like protein [Actinocrispum wychmicini]